METFVFCGFLILAVIFLLIKGVFDQKKNEAWMKQKLRNLRGETSPYQLNMDALCHVKRFFEKHPSSHQVDDITWDDLDMNHLFERMNYTQSSCGEEFLYHTLRTPVFREEELNKLEEKVQYFNRNEDKRVDTQFLCSKLGKLGKYSLYDYLDHLDLLGEVKYFPLLIWDFALVLSVLLMIYSLPIGMLVLVGVICHNILVYFKKKKEIEPYIISFGYIFNMLSILQDLTLLLDESLFSDEITSLQNCKAQMKQFKRGSFLVMNPRNSNLGSNPFEILIDYACMILFVDLLKFNQMLALVRGQIETIEKCLKVIGSLETEISIGLYRTSLKNGYCIPCFGEERLEAVNCYHPLLTEPVKNSVAKVNNVLLTGSNASGKSTFLKTIAVNLLFAETIHTCTADSFGTDFFEVITSMSLKDSLLDGDSYYIAEIKAIKRMFDKIKDNRPESVKVFCFLDEILRGTNTVERIAGAAQILKALAATDSKCFAATHDIELTDLLESYFANYHFEESVEKDDIFFSYELLEGKATSRNAIKLLQCMGFDQTLVEEAEERATQFLMSGKWIE